jgi:hypothetical protein
MAPQRCQIVPDQIFAEHRCAGKALVDKQGDAEDHSKNRSPNIFISQNLCVANSQCDAVG